MEDFLRSFFLPCTLGPKSSMSSSESEVKKNLSLPTTLPHPAHYGNRLLAGSTSADDAPRPYHVPVFSHCRTRKKSCKEWAPIMYLLLCSQNILQRIHPWPLLTFVACLCQSWIANQLDWGNRKWLFVSQSSADQDYQSEASSNIVRHILQYRERHP